MLNSLTVHLHKDKNGNISLDLEAPKGQEVGPIYHRIADLVEQLEDKEPAP